MKPVDEPMIAVLMAVYEPNLAWFREQLASIEKQTYPNLRLYVCDDASEGVSHEQIREIVNEQISRIPTVILRNERNLGSGRTFERLTREAEGTYFAYCDQDDVWCPEKLSVLKETLENENALLTCSDMYVIDGTGKQIADRIGKVRRHQVLRSGSDLAAGLLTRNFVTGTAMLIRADQAKAAVPFCPLMVHDHYLALYAAEQGKIVSVRRPLLRYRIHGNNQTSAMKGVVDKKSYAELRITKAAEQLTWLKENLRCSDSLSETIEQRLAWLKVRGVHWNEKKLTAELWKRRKCSRAITWFELVAVYFPEKLFQFVIGLYQKNLI